MIEIYDRDDVKWDVPISYGDGLWACHISNKYRYNIQAKPIAIFDTLEEVIVYFKSKNLDIYGLRG